MNPDGTQSYGRIDLYKRGCVRAGNQARHRKARRRSSSPPPAHERKRKRRKGHGTRGTAAWNDTLLRARGQAEQYARGAHRAKKPARRFSSSSMSATRSTSTAEFTQTGGTYIPFPDPHSSRIRLADLADDENPRPAQSRLARSPLARPGPPQRQSHPRHRRKPAELANSLETAKHDPHDVAQFLMRCLFTMFAEDVGLLPKHGFRDLLKSARRARASSSPWPKTSGGK